MEHYGNEYFKIQKRVGCVGGVLNKFKFENDVEENDVLMDFGCGGGYLLSNFSNANKFGYEINPSAIDNCKSLGIRVYNNFDDIEDKSVNVIISNHALEHVTHPYDILETLKKKLVMGGKLVVVVPCEQPSEQSFYFKENDNNQHLHTWSPMTLGNLVNVVGFKVLSSLPFQHQWCPDYEKNYNAPDFHQRCTNYAKNNGNYQIKLVAVKCND